MSDDPAVVLTIGHSTRSLEELLNLLQENAVDAVADVRTSPYSSRLPWFNREALTTSLEHVDIRYVFLGHELGGRGSGPGVMGPDGRVSYSKVAATSIFDEGLQRVIAGSTTMRIALLCSEKDPLNCHRGLLVARQLHKRGVPITHIIGNGVLESHRQFEARLLDVAKLPPELTRPEEEVLEEAYDRQSSKVAYKDESNSGEEAGT